MPALDEEQALPLVLAELPADRIDRVVVVDNGSRDRTAEVARSGGAEVVHEPVKGYGQACLAGIDRLRRNAAGAGEAPDGGESSAADSSDPDHGHEHEHGAPLGSGDVIAFCDADRSDYPEDLRAVLAPKGTDQNDSKPRK